ncbi:hypothetical protein ACH42_06345 [Endozoicomonas sp. (ex Bugula neritina AB1)]|nr:hypothetical protein ACH42_06345 [Endozoicomonas sp. (ex Bugula neritina AB1)]
MIEGISPVTNQGGCPKYDSRELLEISNIMECRNYWYSENSFPAAGALRTKHKKIELRQFMEKKVAPIAFACPCTPGEPIDITQGGTVMTVGFAYYRNWVALDPCEVEEECVIIEDDNPYEKVPYLEKYRRHVAAKTAALTTAVRERYELMATFIKLWGSYVVSGYKMDSYLLDFQRNPCLTVVLKQNYEDINTFPIDDFKHYKQLFRMNTVEANGRGGQSVVRATFGVDAWHTFSQHHQVIKKGYRSACDCQEPENDLGLRADDCGMEFVGILDGTPIYVDGRTYMDIDGQEKYYMPQDALMFESSGMRGLRAHSTIYSPSADFRPGDFHFRETFCEEDEVWKLDVQGSILMFPRNVNSSMVIRNIGPVRTFPGCYCQDRLIDSEGHISAPPAGEKGCGDGGAWEKAMQAAVDATHFAICALLLGRTPPRIPCYAGCKGECVPGQWCAIAPNKNPCPTAPKRCISKATLLEQGFDDRAIAEAVYYAGLEPRTLEECLAGLVVTPSGMPAAQAPDEAGESKQLGEENITTQTPPKKK